MEELIECICDYIKKPYTDYAIMINGEWGSGKTYFWNHKLRKRLESLKINGKNYQTIYMSLYGINHLEEISKKIFIETNPMLHKTLKGFVDTKDGNAIPEYVKTGLDMANFFGSSHYHIEKVDFSKMFSVENKILCFDDLERANVEVIDILGYINNFVEHDGIKTILICNEKELAMKYRNKNIELKTMIATDLLNQEKKDQGVPLASRIEEKIADIFPKSNDYERIKEKLIGETFEYIPEYAYILSGMIMKYTHCEKLSNFLKRNTAIIIAAFRKSGTKNLRILKHALNDFEKIFQEVMIEFSDIDEEILRAMLTFTLAVSFEIKSGSMSKEKLKEIRNNEEYQSLLYTSKLLQDDKQFYLQEFDQKYFSNYTLNYKFFKFIELYIRTRVLDEKMLKNNIQEACHRMQAKKEDGERLYLKLLSGEYLRYSNTDFDSFILQVINEVEEGKVSFFDYVKLWIVFQYLIKEKVVLYEIEELLKIFEAGMEKASDTLVFPLDRKKAEKYDDEQLKELSALEKKLVLRKEKEYFTCKTEELLTLFQEDISTFYLKMTKEYLEVPILAYCDIDMFYHILVKLSNYDLNNMIELFRLRYLEHLELKNKEKKNLKLLAQKIQKEQEKEKRTVKDLLLLQFAILILDILG